MDTKFSVAVHILAMINESERTLTSNDLAISTGTNASYIRKVIGLLKKADLICSHQGKSGYQLTKQPNQMSLLDIYYATQEVTSMSLFQMHKNANEKCPVGQYIQGALTPMFSEVETQLTNQMSHQSLADVIANLYLQSEIAR